MEGSKSIFYYDIATHQIKVSRNFAFNENDELQELKIFTDLPGLQVKEEQEPDSDPVNPPTPDITSKITPTQETPSSKPNFIFKPANNTTRPVQKWRKSLDYRQMNNPEHSHQGEFPQ